MALEASKLSADAHRPCVSVLLATYNGAAWLDEQVESIFAQAEVNVNVVASDDASRDATSLQLSDWSKRARLETLPVSHVRSGSAHRNFLRLIREAPLGDAEYIALSDQDDIWLPGKLARAVAQLRAQDAQAFSSDVIAFWPDGKRRLVRKSHPQRRHDHLFGSPGPGCTFVIRRDVFDAMRNWIEAGHEHMLDIWVHDWLLYAYVRHAGHRWVIDSEPLMLYRQHGHNEIGVNAGWRAALSRWRHVRSGAYRRDILGIADAIGDVSRAVAAVRRLRWRDRLWLVAHSREFRRRASESLMLAVLLLFMPRGRP